MVVVWSFVCHQFCPHLNYVYRVAAYACAMCMRFVCWCTAHTTSVCIRLRAVFNSKWSRQRSWWRPAKFWWKTIRKCNEVHPIKSLIDHNNRHGYLCDQWSFIIIIMARHIVIAITFSWLDRAVSGVNKWKSNSVICCKLFWEVEMFYNATFQTAFHGCDWLIK